MTPENLYKHNQWRRELISNFVSKLLELSPEERPRAYRDWNSGLPILIGMDNEGNIHTLISNAINGLLEYHILDQQLRSSYSTPICKPTRLSINEIVSLASFLPEMVSEIQNIQSNNEIDKAGFLMVTSLKNPLVIRKLSVLPSDPELTHP